MDKDIQIKCSCGEVLLPVLNEEFNYKDTISCECGRKFLIVDISE